MAVYHYCENVVYCAIGYFELYGEEEEKKEKDHCTVTRPEGLTREHRHWRADRGKKKKKELQNSAKRKSRIHQIQRHRTALKTPYRKQLKKGGEDVTPTAEWLKEAYGTWRKGFTLLWN